MSREIKVRVWSDQRKAWLGVGEPLDKYIWYSYDDNKVTMKIPGEYIGTIEQHTGLKDKNGKEIYEGDIVSIRNKNHKNEYDIGVVEFGKGAFRCPFLLGKYQSGQVEVIGNIHENPELLGGEE